MNKKISPFKDRLKQALEQRQMRPVDLCNKTKISQSTMSQYLSGYAEPKKERLTIIADALNVNPTWLMGLDVEMEHNITKSSEQAFWSYLDSLGYHIYKDDPEHIPFLSSQGATVLLRSDSINSLKLRIDSYAKATVDSEMLALKEEEIRQERLEKERLMRQMRGENISTGSQFEKDWAAKKAKESPSNTSADVHSFPTAVQEPEADYLKVNAAQTRTDRAVTQEELDHDEDLIQEYFRNKEKSDL